MGVGVSRLVKCLRARPLEQHRGRKGIGSPVGKAFPQGGKLSAGGKDSIFDKEVRQLYVLFLHRQEEPKGCVYQPSPRERASCSL